MVLLLTLSSLSLLGCKSQELSEPLTRDYQTLDGQMTSLGGIKVNKVITNVFQVEDDGQVFYAYSDRYDLNDAQYLGKRIEAYGLVTTHTELDKSLFEIRRISDAPEETVDIVTVEDKEYSNQDIGFKLTYSNDWKLEEKASSVSFTAPIVLESGTGSLTEELSTSQNNDPDFVSVKVTSSKLIKTSTDPLDDRADEIRDFVRVNYSNLVGVGSELSYLGVDKLFAVRYKTLTGDIYYFAPKSSSLFEISFNHPSTSDKVDHTNIFYDMIASFRYIPAESNTSDEVISDVEVEKTETTIKEEPEVEEISAVIEIPTGFREFESTPFKFKILYPSSWYYSGGSSGYDFNNEPIEDDTKVLIRLDMSSTGTTGSANTGDIFSITSKVGDRYYKLSGSSELKSTMETMSKSIEEITE